MKVPHLLSQLIRILFVVLAFSLLPTTAYAHCDGLDGPVVNAARNALDTGNVNLVLIWVQQHDVAEIKNAFQKALSVRKLGAPAKEMADNYFFETLVRVHRASEGAGYTGLKPAGRDLGPAVPAADKAIETGSVNAVAKLLTDAVDKRLREQFNEVATKKKFDKDDVVAGRRYVAAYVEYVHYVERIYEAATQSAHGHYPEAASVMHKD